MKNKDKKTEFKYFTIPEWKKEQDYLQEQHNNGWKFTGVSFIGFYHFKKCDPEDVVYQLDYNPEGTSHKTEYIQMFRDCGWEYLQDFVGYSYFRKPVSEMNGHEEIFCDEASKVDMMNRVFKGRIIPLIIIFFCIILPQLLLQNHLDRPLSNILTGEFIVLCVLYLAIFLSFGYQYWIYWKVLHK